MARREERKARGSKLTRSETVTVRLDPKLRYLAELAARKQRRTVSSFIEWAIEDSLSRVALRETSGRETSVADAAAALWDVDEADRFLKLVVHYPDLLNHDEQVLWKLVQENGYVTRPRESTGKPVSSRRRLREHWDVFVAVAKGQAGEDKLPAPVERDTAGK
jgi:hypothetical protein